MRFSFTGFSVAYGPFRFYFRKCGRCSTRLGCRHRR